MSASLLPRFRSSSDQPRRAAVITDDVDGCVSEPEDYDKFEDQDGCPDIDNDGDGIPDSADSCSDQAKDRDNFDDEDGCPELDNDRDGVLDTIGF